jgi:hypothetical protein
VSEISEWIYARAAAAAAIRRAYYRPYPGYKEYLVKMRSRSN